MEDIMSYKQDKDLVGRLFSMQDDINKHLLMRMKRAENILQSLSDAVWDEEDEDNDDNMPTDIKDKLSTLLSGTAGFTIKKR